MKDDEKLEGVALVRAILKNLHESLKWLWLIVMGLAIVNAIEVYSKFLDTDDIKSIKSHLAIDVRQFKVSTSRKNTSRNKVINLVEEERAGD